MVFNFNLVSKKYCIHMLKQKQHSLVAPCSILFLIILFCFCKGWGHKIDDGVVAMKIRIAPYRKVATLWDFACQACWERAPTTKKVLYDHLKKKLKKTTPPPSPYLLSKTSSVPLSANVWRRLSFFWMASLNSLAGDKVLHELKERLMVLDLSYLSRRDEMTLVCISLKA